MAKIKKTYKPVRRSRSGHYSWQGSRAPRRSGPSPWLIFGGIFSVVVIIGVIVLLSQARPPTSISQRPVSQPTSRSTAIATSLPALETTVVATPNSQSSEPGTPAPFNQSYLRQFMLDLINADRAAAGLSFVAWDDTAAYAGQIHAEEMAMHGYLSHWNLEGDGPDYRYTRAGGLCAVQENVYSWYHRYDNGSPVLISDWEVVIREAQIALMNSPGHRSAILNPAHTHVGIGLAYNDTNGEFRIAQEFVGRYVQLDPLPRKSDLGTRLRISGQLLVPAAELLLNLAYEPFPTPMDIQALNATSTFQSSAEIYDSLAVTLSADGRFSESVILDYEGRSGRYHVRLWMKTIHGDIPITTFILDVR